MAWFTFMQRRNLGRTGVSLSVLGFGASPLGDVFNTVDSAEGIRAVHYAIDHGIDFFDVSPYYGDTLAEERLGAALAGKRNSIFLATKCGRYRADDFDFSPKRIKGSLDESLARLRTEYVDLLQAHDVEFGDVQQIIEETIPALHEIQRTGKARFIGITGYQLRMLAEIAGTTAIDTVLSYCRHTLLVSDMDTLLTPVVQEKGLGLILASPLHMGLLTGRGVPSWHPASRKLKEAASRIVELCRKHGADPVAVALRYCLDHPYAASILVGMSSAEQVKRNLSALDTALDPALLSEIHKISTAADGTVWASGLPENADYITSAPRESNL